ncbi:MAG: hypothetical protein P8170_13765 [Gemmatimonadota bacterium]
MGTHVQHLERRLSRLERTNRILVALLGLGVVMALLSAVRVPQTTELLRVKRVQLVDDEGRVRIDLRHSEDETGLFIMDEAGDTRVGAAQFAHGGGGFALHGPALKGAAVLYLAGEGSLSMYDTAGARTARFPEAER